MKGKLFQKIKPWISMHYRNLQLRLQKNREVSLWRRPLKSLPSPVAFLIFNKVGTRIQIFNVRYFQENGKHIVAFITSPHEEDWKCRAFTGSEEGRLLKIIARYAEAGCKVYCYEFTSSPKEVLFQRFWWTPKKKVNVQIPYAGSATSAISTLCFERLDLLRDWVDWHRNRGVTLFIIYVNHESIPKKTFDEVNSLGVEIQWMAWPFPYYHRTVIWPKRDMHWAQPAQMIDALLHVNHTSVQAFTNIDTDEFILAQEQGNINSQLPQTEIPNVWASLPQYRSGYLCDNISKAKRFNAWEVDENFNLWASEGMTRHTARARQRGKCTLRMPFDFDEIPLPHQLLPAEKCPINKDFILLHFADIAGRRRFREDIPWKHQEALPKNF